MITLIALLVVLVGPGAYGKPATESSSSDAAQEGDASRVVAGRVVFPTDTPADAHAEAVLRVEFLHDESLAAILGSTESELARVPVERDGSFRLPRPIGVRAIRVSVEGDYLVDQGYRFEPGGDADPAESPIVLEPTVGAHVTFVLVQPPGHEESARTLVGRTLHYTWMAQGTGDPCSYGSVEIEEDLTAVVRAQTPAELRFGNNMAVGSIAPFVVQSSFACTPRAGIRERFELPLVRLLEFSGRVLGAGGAPLAGATVKIGCSGQIGTRTWATNHRTDTDAAGRFRLERIVPPITSLEVTAQDHLALELEAEELTAVLASADDLELNLQHCARIRGTVHLADGRPVARLVVMLFAAGSSEPRQVQTDSTGRFEAAGLDLSSYRIEARGALSPRSVDAPGAVELSDLGSERTGSVGPGIDGPELALYAEGIAPSDTDHHLVLASSAPGLSLRVVDDSGVPVEDFHLVLERGGKGPFAARDLPREGVRGTRVHAPGGLHRVDGLTAGELEVWVCNAPVVGCLRSQVVPLTIGATQLPCVDLVLPRPGAISGRVELSEGVDRSALTHKMVTAFLVEPPRRHPLRSAHIAPDGTYTLERLPPGHYALELMAFEAVHASVVALDLAANEQRTGVTIATLRGAFVDVRLLDHSGQPYDRPRIEFMRADGVEIPWHVRVRESPPESIGFVRLGPFTAGELVLSARVSGGRATRSVTERVVVEAGRTHRVTLSASSNAPCSLVGNVTSAGAPCVGYRVHLTRLLGGEGGGVTDASGKFQVHMPEGGAWTMMVRDPVRNLVHQREVVLPEIGELPLEVVLASGEVRGRLSPPLPPGDSFGFKLSLATDDGSMTIAPHRWPCTQPMEDGTFLLQHVPPGRYRIVGVGQSRRPGVPAATAESAEFDVSDGIAIDEMIVDVVALK